MSGEEKRKDQDLLGLSFESKEDSSEENDSKSAAEGKENAISSTTAEHQEHSDQSTSSNPSNHSAQQSDQPIPKQPLIMDKLKQSDLDEMRDKHKSIINSLFRLPEKHKLDKTNWEQWLTEFSASMRSVCLWEFANEDWEDALKSRKDWMKLDEKARDNLLINVSETLQLHIKKLKSARDMFNKLKALFQGSKVIQGWRLCRTLVTLVQHKSDELDENALAYQNLVSDFQGLFPQIPTEFYVSLFCAIIPDRYDYLLSDVLSGKEEDISYEKIVDLIMAAHARQLEKSKDSGPIVSSISHFNKSNDQNGKQINAEKGRSKAKKKKFDRSKLYCDYCDQKGHSEDRCWKKASDIISGKIKSDQSSNEMRESSQGDASVATASNREVAKQKRATPKPPEFDIGAFIMNFGEQDDLDQDKLYLDTCAGVCAMNHKRGCTKMVEHRAQVAGWDGHVSTINGIGEYSFITEEDVVLHLKDVVYKATAAASYISWGKLDATGRFRLSGQNGILQIHEIATDRLVCTATRVRMNIYELNFRPYHQVIVARVTIKPTVPTEFLYRFWHRKLSHISFGTIDRCSHLLGIRGKPGQRLVCDICTAAAASKIPFGISDSRASKPFELIHADLSGIVRIANPLNVKYFLVLIDDHTRYMTVFLTGTKAQIANAYSQYTNWVRVQFNAVIKSVRSDNGTEFTNRAMHQLIEQSGAVHQKTCHGNPQQNARVERAMRTIECIARSILKDEKLSVRFWPFAVMYAVYLKNRLPHAGIDFEIPFKVLFEQYPKLTEIIKFGIVVYVLQLQPDGKFGDRAQPAIFLGYPEGVKGFYVYLIEQRKVDITRDVFTSEQLAKSDVDIGTAYKVNPADSDLYMDENDDCYLNPIYRNEAETAADELLECLGDDPEDDWHDQSQFFSANSSSVSISQMQSDDQTSTLHDADALPNPNIVGDQPKNSIDAQSDAQIDGQQQSQPEIRQTVQSEATKGNQPLQNPKILSDVIDMTRQDHTEQPKGRFIANQKDKAWFKQVFPAAIVKHEVPYQKAIPGKSKKGMSIVSISAIRAPKSFKEAMSAPFISIFKAAMDKEIGAQHSLQSWELVPRPIDAEILPVIWIYKYLFDSKGLVIGGKARLVVLGDRQEFEIGELNYAAVLNDTAYRTVLSLLVKFGLHGHHIDCDTAFLNAEVRGNVYTNQPAGYVVPGKESYVCKLKSPVYGLRQSARQWFIHLKKVLIDLGFKQLFVDLCLYIKRMDNGNFLLIAVYVDDLLAVSNRESLIAEFKQLFGQKIKFKDHGPISKFLNVNINYDRLNKRLELSQTDYIEKILLAANFEECKGVKLPIRPVELSDRGVRPDDSQPIDVESYREIVGMLIYLANLYRYDIACTVSMLCSHMQNPTVKQGRMLKHLLRYLQYSKKLKLVYTAENAGLASDSDLIIYADSSFKEDKSRMGILTFVCGNLVSWMSKKQQRVVTSTSESEILAVCDSINEIEFVVELLKEIGFEHLCARPCAVFNDNLSAKASVNNGGKFENNKHYRPRLNRIIRAVEEEQVQLHYTTTSNMLADMLTKPVPAAVVAEHNAKIGLI